MFLLFGLLFGFDFAHACLSDAPIHFCHIRTPMELNLFEKDFLGYPWYSAYYSISHLAIFYSGIPHLIVLKCFYFHM